MKCPKCQFENRERAKFCKECGANLEATCSECGTVYELGSKFCDECGFDLRKSSESQSYEYSRPESYTPKFLADKILTSRSSIEGERKLVTVLFADVANYTAIAEKLDPEIVHQMMDGCFNILMNEIHKYEGTINQFTGDGIMALFGAPVAHEDHAQRACHAALSIQNSIADYGKKIEKDLAFEFKMRIGINSGPVVVGAIGDDLRMDYTAIGDTTNLASRIESVASPGSIFVSKNTYNLAGDYFEFRPGEKVDIKGKEEYQEIYELLRPGAIDSRIEASAAKGLTKFVGRKNSMSALNEALKKAVSGSGQVVGIVGEAGVGKSRLIFELRRSLQKDKVYFLEGKCLHYGGAIAYLPVLDILKSYFDIKEGDTETSIKKKMEDKILHLDDKLQNCLPPFQELSSLKVDDELFKQLEPKQKKERIFEAIRDLFIRESQNQPLVLVIEDLHWIDRTSEELIDFFIGWLAKSAVLLILLYRPEYTHQWGSKSYYDKIGLDHLTHKSGTKLIKAILNDCEIEPELENLILNRAAGNPLFIEELTHNLLENGSIQKEANQCVLSKSANSIQVPDSLQGIIAARIDRIEETLKRIIQVASVIGREFAYRILQSITEPKEELKSQLFNLQSLEFIYEKCIFPELEYIFKHALTQEVAYNSLLLKKRKEIHRQIGETIEQIYSERLEEFFEILAYHFVQGDVWDKAVTYLLRSGRQAMRKSSYVEAITHLQKGLELLIELPETVERAELELSFQFDLGASLIVFKGYIAPEVEQAYSRSYDLCRQLGETPKLIPVMQGLRRLYALRGDKGDGQRALQLGNQLLALAQRQNDPALLQEAHWALGQTFCYLGELLPAHTHLEQSNTFYTPDSLFSQVNRDAAGTQIACLVHMARVLWALGYPDQALKACDEALCLAQELQHPFTLAFALWGITQINKYRREVQTTFERAEATIALSKEQGFSLWLVHGIPLRGWALVMQGKLGEGLAQINQILGNKKSGIPKASLPMYYTLLVEAYQTAGENQKGLYVVADAIDLVEKTGFFFYETELCRLKGELLLERTDPDRCKAEAFLYRAIDLARSKRAKSLELRAAMSLSRAWYQQGKKKEAYHLLGEIYGWFTEGFDTLDLQEAKSFLEKWR